MMFNIMLLDEMGYTGWVVERTLFTTTVDRTVDKELDVLFDGFVY